MTSSGSGATPSADAANGDCARAELAAADAGWADQRDLAAGRDVRALVAAWADPTRPRAQRRHCPEDELACLAEFGYTNEVLEVLLNPVVGGAVKAALAARMSRYSRRGLTYDLLGRDAPVPVWVAISPVLTATALHGVLAALDPDDHWSAAARAQITDPRRLRAELLRGFIGAREPKARALMAEAAPLWTGARHSYATGRLSAPTLAAHADAGVRVGLARNPHLRQLPDDPAGIAVRETLLGDDAARVRTAARRNGVQVTQTDISALMEAHYQRHSSILGGSPDARVAAAHQPVEPPLPLRWSGLVVGDPLDDPDPRVRATAVRSGVLRDPDRWQRVVTDPSHVVRGAAATHGYLTPRPVWDRLADDTDRRVRLKVVRSRWVSPLLLRRMTGDPDPAVRALAQQRITGVADEAAGGPD